MLQTGLGAAGEQVRILAPQGIWGKRRPPIKGMQKWLGYADQYLLFPSELKRAIRWADMVHVCDQGNAIYLNYLQKVPHLITCHDLIAIKSAKGELPGVATGTTGKVYQHLIWKGLKRANYVVCDSETTKSDLFRLCNVPEAKTSVIPISLLHKFHPMLETERRVILYALGIAPEEEFVLHVGGNQFYKNRLGLLHIYNTLKHGEFGFPMRLVLAGKPLSEAMRRYIVEQGLEASVLELTDLENEQIRALYSRAKALIFPSLYEGFGLPIIEAQACGCPVFTSNRAPMTEVGGNAAVYFDPTQPEAAAQIIAAHLEATDWMVSAGLENVKRFTLERMIEEYLQTYRRLLDRAQ